MLCRTVGAIAAIAVGANAFLLPPSVYPGVSSASSSSDLVIDPQSQAIKIPCPACVFPSKEAKATETEEGDGLLWAQGSANDVILNFTVTDDMKTLNLNGWQLYPVTMDQPGHPTLDQIAASASLADAKQNPEKKTPLEVSGASIFVNEEHASPTGDKIVSVTYQIVSLEGQPMSIDGAEVKLLEGADGSLMIIDVESVSGEHNVFESMPLPRPHPQNHRGGNRPHGMRPHKDNKKCGMLPAMLCKWVGMVESKVDGFKQGMPHKLGGCGGRKSGKGPKGGRPHKLPTHNRPHLDTFKGDKPEAGNPASDVIDLNKIDLDKSEHEGRPHHHHGGPPRPHRGPHGAHHHRHHRHFLHRVLRAFVVVLVPVMAGISMGIFVSLVGMLVGRLISFLWIKLRRGGQRGYASVAQSEIPSEESSDMEKGAIEVVVEEEEALPVYEDAPAYEEKEKK